MANQVGIVQRGWPRGISSRKGGTGHKLGRLCRHTGSLAWSDCASAKAADHREGSICLNVPPACQPVSMYVMGAVLSCEAQWQGCHRHGWGHCSLHEAGHGSAYPAVCLYTGVRQTCPHPCCQRRLSSEVGTQACNDRIALREPWGLGRCGWCPTGAAWRGRWVSSRAGLRHRGFDRC